MPIAITDEHQELGATVRGVLTAHDSLAANRALLEASTELRPSYWQEMADLGWLGIHLPEEHGGAGAGLCELIVVLDELGRQVAPGPFLPTVLASAVIARCGSDEQRAYFLPGLADGSVVAALGLGGSLTLRDGVLDGDGGIVLGGAGADLLLLRAGDDLVALPRGAEASRWAGRRTSTRRGARHGSPCRPSGCVTTTCWRAPCAGRRAAGPHARRGRGRGRHGGLHGRRGGLCQGAGAVRTDHRHVPGRQAPLRGHAGGGRAGHGGRVGCRTGLGGLGRRVRPRRRHGGPAGLRARACTARR